MDEKILLLGLANIQDKVLLQKSLCWDRSRRYIKEILLSRRLLLLRLRLLLLLSSLHDLYCKIFLFAPLKSCPQQLFDLAGHTKRASLPRAQKSNWIQNNKAKKKAKFESEHSGLRLSKPNEDFLK